MSWPTVPISDITKIVGGGTPTRDNPEFYGGDIPWITPKDMKRWDITTSLVTISELGLKHSAARLVPRDSVLVVVRSGVLKHSLPVGITRQPVAINQDMKALIPDERVQADYLARFVKARSQQILGWVRATTADNFDVAKLRSLHIPLPSLVEQKRIAEVLDGVDALRAKRRHAIALLDDLAQSVFHELFGNPATNLKGLPVRTLGEVLKVKSGNFLPASEMSPKGEFPVYGGNGISGHHNHFLFDRPTIVIGRVGVYCGCVHLAPAQSWVTDNALYVERVMADFTEHYLYKALEVANLNQYASQSAQPLISSARIYPVSIIVPPLDLQQQFTERVEAIEAEKVRHRAHLAKLDELFNSVQSLAFAGTLFG